MRAAVSVVAVAAVAAVSVASAVAVAVALLSVSGQLLLLLRFIPLCVGRGIVSSCCS